MQQSGKTQSLTVNGKVMESPAATLEALLEDLFLQGQPLVAEVNGVIVKQENFAATALQNGDSIELVRFVGGG